jgi:hypothetical protein
MRWKRVAWAGCLVPAVGGCSVGVHAARDAAAETRAAHAGRGVDRAIRQAAREAWRGVADEHPRRAFTAEFRDGFLDGYADYLDRGGDGQPPAAPPARYAHNPKYFSPEGHALLRHYFLGFRYGAEVAIASGRRHYFTVPVLIPDTGPGSGGGEWQQEGRAVPSADLPLATATPPVASAPPGPRPADPLPAPRKVPPGPAAGPPQPPALVGAPAPPPEPAPAKPAVPEVGPPKFLALPPLPAEVAAPAPRELPPPRPLTPAGPVGTGLPLPPAEVPEAPDGVPLPVLDPLPPLPPNTAEVIPLPPSYPDGEK